MTRSGIMMFFSGYFMNYKIDIKNNVLIFKTSFFSAEKGSVLHSGIYNKEFTSALASMSIAVIVSAILIMHFGKTIFFYIISIIILIVSFPLFRKFVFKEKYLEAIFNSSTKKAEIYMTGIARKKNAEIAFDNIKNIVIEKKKTGLENPDGVKFVKKISLQHGTVIPGFGEEKIFFLLKLKLSDGSDRIIYTDNNMQDVISAHDKIKGFLEII